MVKRSNGSKFRSSQKMEDVIKIPQKDKISFYNISTVKISRHFPNNLEYNQSGLFRFLILVIISS